MSENELIVLETAIAMPAMSIQQATQRYQQMKEFVGSILQKGVDYGRIPGTDKDTLLKPGAEKLTTFFGLTPKFSVIEKAEEWNALEPFFYYWFRCHLYRGSLLVAEGDGSCNSRESRYRWRWVPKEEAKGLDLNTLKSRSGRKSEFTFAVDKGETGGRYGKPDAHWQEFRDAIADGTAKKIKRSTRAGREMDAWEIGSTLYRVLNEDIASQVNTIQKMAQKRSLVAATLIGVNASDYFTQDLEDLDYGAVIEGVATPVETATQAPQAQPEQQKVATASPAKTNGRPWNAEKTRNILHYKVEGMPGTQKTALASARQVGLVASKLEECFAPDADSADKRRSVLKHIWQVDSAKDLTSAQARATIDWLLIDESRVPQPDRTYDLHSAAPVEAANALKAAMLAAGQEELI